MGTNLLNLSPFYLDKRTRRGARLRLLRLAFQSFTLLAQCFCLFDPNLPLQLVTAVTSGSPFGFLADSLREGSCLKSVRLIHLTMSGFQGTLVCLATPDFLRKLSATCITFCFAL